jgi:hypothetical protein
MAASRASGADDPLAWVQPADVVCNGGGQLAGGAGDDDHGNSFLYFVMGKRQNSD